MMEVLENYSGSEFSEKEIYPAIWMSEDEEELKEELCEAFLGLKEFYRKLADNEKGVIVSIY